MRKLILQQWISLDGFVADKQGELNFFQDLNEEGKKYSDEAQLKFIKERLDTMVLGRKTYELFAEFWPTEYSKVEIISDALNELNKVVISKSLKEAPWGKWSPAEVMKDPVEAIKKLKSKSGKDIVVWGSISVCEPLMKQDLFDEYHFQVCPIILGEGRPMFPDQKPKKLKLKSERKYDTGVVFVEFERVK